MRRWLSFILVFALAVGGTGFTSWHLFKAETRQIETDFQRNIALRASQLNNELVKLRATMRYWRKFYETSDSSIQPEQFRSIARDVLKSYPSLQAVGWAPLVSKEQRAAYEAPLRNLNPNFTIFTLRSHMNKLKADKMIDVSNPGAFDPALLFAPSSEQPLYFPITVIEPKERLGFLVGLDIGSVNVIAVSAQVKHARDSGSADIVALPGLLSPFSPNNEPILVALAPTYLHAGASGPKGRNDLQGFIATIFSVGELVFNASLADKPQDIGIELIDRTGDEGLKTLYRYGPEIESRMTYTHPIVNVLGRRWEMVASPSDSFIDSRRTLVPYLVLIGGTLFTALFLLYSNLMQRQTEMVQTEVDNRTSELQRANSELNTLNEKLKHLSRIDSLTDVANRRFFNETFQNEWKRAYRERMPLTLLMIDVDHFKEYNDEYGHLRGDESLQQVAKVLKDVFKRSVDLVARYGGEEFAVILPNCSSEARDVAEHCRKAIEGLNIPHQKSLIADHITVSIGMSYVIPTESLSPEELLNNADKALYAAKDKGRNRVVYIASASQENDRLRSGA